MRTIALTLLLACVATAPAQPHAYRAARLWPGDGPPVRDAVLVVENGKVVAAGPQTDVKVPPGAVTHDLGDATIVPGLIAAETTLAERGRDDLLALAADHRAIDGFDPYADFTAPLAGGVTTVQVSPGGKRLVPGQSAVVKLAGDIERRTLREDESLRVVLGEPSKNPPRVYLPPVGAVSVDRPLEPTRPQLGGANALAGLRAAFRAARAEPGSRDAFLRAVGSAGTAKKPLRVTATTAADVHAALTLAREFGLKLVLVDPPGPAREKLGDWKAHVVGVVLGPGLRPGRTPDAEPPARPPAEAARDLRAAGIRVALKPADDADLKELLYLAGLFTTHGTRADALRMVTADAAELLGVADRVGTLAAGKDADFVVLSGEPFALQTRVRAAYVEGRPAHEAKPAAARKVVRAGRLLTGTGELIENGAVVVEGGTVRAVGRVVSVPADAEEKRYPNAVIVPGFIDLGTGLGLGGPVSSPVPLSTKLADRLVAGDAAVSAARKGGITTALLVPPGTTGPVLAFKLGDKPRAVKEPAAIHVALRGNLTTAGASLRDTLRTGKSYADGWAKYEAELPEYERKKAEFDAAQARAPAAKKDEKKDDKKEEKKPEPPKAPEKPTASDVLEPYRALFAGKIPLFVEARREDALRLAVTIARDEFNVRTVLLGADDAHRVADLLGGKSVAVVAGPELVRTVGREEVNLPLALALRGVPVGFQSRATSGSRHLPTAVGFAVRHGLGADDALRGLTAGAAGLAGLDTAGTLAAGKDADLVVLSGMPFEPSTRVLAVMIDGKWVETDPGGSGEASAP